MRTCSRCRSSMIVDYGAPDDGGAPVWKCLGCGRSVHLDHALQAEEEWLQEWVRRQAEEHPRSRTP
jgi:hypothetical protein